jgi:signal peptide peptidase SppA
MHSSLPHLLRSLTAEPLVIERRTLDAFLSVLRRRSLEGASFSGPELHAELGIATPRSQRGASTERRVEVIPVVGTIMNRAHSMGAGAVQIGDAIDRAVSDARVDAIVLDVDSPGGTVTGVPELAAKVRAAREAKPVVAVANGMMASAAYWIASQASEVVASPSSDVGSIGVFAMHEDWSKWLENEGVAVTEIAAGKFKTEGAPWKPLDAEGEEFFRSRVTEVYDWFVRDVAAGRGDSPSNVRGGYGEGRVLGAKDAKATGLVDRIETLDETLARLTAGRSPRARTRAEVQVRRGARRG